MADSKITALAALTAADPANDMVPIVDVSDNSMAASGTTKRISINNILACSPSATLASATITGNLTLSAGTVNGVGYLNASKVLTAGSALVFDGTNLGIGGTGQLRFATSGGAIGDNTIGTENSFSMMLRCGRGVTSNIELASDKLVFSTNMSERYRIASDGVATWSNVGGVAGTAMTLNSTGLGVGVTPSAWGASFKAIQVSGGASLMGDAANAYFGNNCYYNGTSWIYSTTNGSSRFELTTSGIKWHTAPSGTAGNAITFTQAMTLAANGQLLLGTSTTNGAIDIGMVMNKPSATGFVGNVYQLNSVDKAFTYIASAASAYRIDTVAGYTVNVVSSTNGVYLANGGTSWLSLSDERFKDIIEPISNAVAKVGSLRSVIGKFKSEAEGTRRSFLLAQDVQAVLPEAVDATKPEQLGLSYPDVIPLLVAAIKELTARVQTLEAK